MRWAYGRCAVEGLLSSKWNLGNSEEIFAISRAVATRKCFRTSSAGNNAPKLFAYFCGGNNFSGLLGLLTFTSSRFTELAPVAVFHDPFNLSCGSCILDPFQRSWSEQTTRLNGLKDVNPPTGFCPI